MLLRLFILVALFAFTLSLPARAALLDFYFTTTGSGGGVVTGEIEGLQSTGTSSPSEIVIFTQPSGFVTGPGGLIANGYAFYGTDNNFTVTGGAITGADIGIYKMFSPTDFQGYGFDVSEIGFTGANGVYQTVGGTVTQSLNAGGFAGTTYTPVPEPAQEAAFLLVLGFLLFGVRKIYTSRLSLRRFPSVNPVL